MCSGKKIIIGENDLATTDPDVAALLADPTQAVNVTQTSNKKLTWRCEKGHEWEAPVSRIAVQGSRCPYCSGRLAIPGETDLATTRPDLAKELARPELATTLKAHSTKKVEWKCPNGHIYEASPANRASGKNCPYCSGRQVMVGENDLATTHPEYVSGLVDTSLATRVTAGSDRKVAWRCANNPAHIWASGVRNRLCSSPNKGCPICANKIIIPGENDLATTCPDLAKELVEPTLATIVCAGSTQYVEWQCPVCGHQWAAAPAYRTYGGTGCPVCNRKSPSRKEQDLANTLRKLGLDIITGDRTILPRKQELDILIPDKSIAIEFNGCRWHSEISGKPKSYHKDKLDACAAAGIRLVFIWEDDWDLRRNVVIRSLAHKLNCIDELPAVLPETYNAKAWQTAYARKLHIKEITNREAMAFLEYNHIQGATILSRTFALIDNDDDIRALLGLRSPRACARMNRPDGTWEIQRYATLGLIPGGFTRLLTAAERALGNELVRWVSFAAADISDGGLYRNAGFYVDHEIPPNYKYVGNRNHWTREPQEKYQKANIAKLKDFMFDNDWTEHEAMLANNMYRIYDAGKTCWAKDIN